MVLIAAFVMALGHRIGGVVAALPILAMLALGAQRLLPIMQQLYGNWSVVMGSKAALAEVLALLDQPLPIQAGLAEPASLSFRESIRFDNVSFQYGSQSSLVLNSVDFTIAKGSRVGIIGSTGSGKSTVLDLLMGLLDPTNGRILVDGKPINAEHRRAWQRTIAHVPQSIFLVDASITENIAFGIPIEFIDIARVHDAAKQAQAVDFIESLPLRYDHIVGERGVRLSGGQRQRIGIARALYKQASVLVFDEATSALDNETEYAVMEAINGLSDDLTLIVIAHRLNTLKNCDVIIKLNAAKVEFDDNRV